MCIERAFVLALARIISSYNAVLFIKFSLFFTMDPSFLNVAKYMST